MLASPPLRRRRHRRGLVPLVLVVALVGAACGGKSADEAQQATSDEEVPEAVETGLTDAGEPVRGGKVTYGIEAETSGGWCLPEAQLAISGIMVARAIYDTLAIPNADGGYSPWLAESFDHNETYDEWTIKVREGVTFHDGSSLTGEVVKNNLDAVRGAYEGRAPLLGLFVFSNVADITLVDDMTVKVTTKVPWVAFPAYLWGSGRFGIMAQAQLDDPETCDRNLIGTGPFEFEDWKVDTSFQASRNADYWLEAPDGEPYPYLDEIEFQPITEGDQRLNALETGDIQAMHTSGTQHTLRLRELQETGEVNIVESAKFGEVGYIMLNASEPPFDDIRVRRALQMGFDREGLNETVGEGLAVLADGPFAPGLLGYLEDPGVPEYDLEKAKALIEEYRTEKGLDAVSASLSTPPDPSTVQLAEIAQTEARKIGLEVELKPVEQAQLINDAIGGSFDATLFRNHPGGDPDGQYVWWRSDSPVNFGRIQDPEIDRRLDAGRSEPDEAKRAELYEGITKQFAEQAWNIWIAYTRWVIGMSKDVHGVYGPELPDGSAPNPGLATGHSMAGMWIATG